ncbi:hypothetical protein COW36_24115 [bacterium (Candidatus Blackallbacteria) CG17_big_fil_post_rev_8_21_14_2_50_48_46]|uniref:MoaB/Mog domain-containing protein n=1 Tax=bacterium (Candidatus Blackallbacteria) CG17_big_fil_post_rev_8_21_14_2_50_48_46 TaxID=2014261 RepID=A0A2M7FYB2_9BACT|nr:MAG: hypothetical protein COW64_19055 [bacterium (Candidatus Blackallbacteria) CG18_big_fil_WC_8_21_14_2_50_49_26]PIW13756.1 MAG: hypothetical protein COW36_24115 [bacterium (Candidatus Blackallbacteria) CG17_big_fil_post_rev_8_21_14_2_50_48_46]PIW44982.1 MAG: hypothetical protein COW20_21745 [bacterium (Candidatus Blackallbacteria) CG13_big_fil_rev_8_21_14_2_50_49_14]
MRIEKICILAIGTELSEGQIINSNAAWLSKALIESGAKECWHLTLADDREQILTGLKIASQHADMLILTGGLGPTSDDFTREVLSTWLDKPLIFDPDSWTHLENRAQLLKFQLSPSQKQQCYFPEGATIIVNPAGTAHAFLCHRQNQPIFVLPGPPSEIQKIWETDLAQRLHQYLPGKAEQKLYRWQCMGLPEADLGDKTEEALKGSLFRIGYRAHSPYVEVKVWVPAEKEAQPWLEKLETALSPWVIVRNEEDLGSHLVQACQKFKRVRLLESGSQGRFQQRLAPYLTPSAFQTPFQIETLYGAPLDQNEIFKLLEKERSDELLFLSFCQASASSWLIVLQQGQVLQQEFLSSPYPEEQVSRNLAVLIEKTLLRWSEWLSHKLEK